MLTEHTPTGGAAMTLAPAAFVQERLWFLQDWLSNRAVYNIPTALKLRGPLDPARLQQALDQLINRHEALRTRFLNRDQQLLQVIAEAARFPFSIQDCAGVSPETLRAIIQAEICGPFDLERDFPIRAKLLKLNAKEHILLISTHHIASDEWSVRIMLAELKQLYRAPDSALPELPIQYADFAAWQNEWLEGGEYQKQIEFWKETLAEVAPMELPLDHARPAVPNNQGARVHVPFPEELNPAVLQLARQFRTTAFNVLFTTFQVLTARYTAREQVLTGTVVAGRNRSESEPLIGFFVNLLAIRTDLPEEATFAEVLRQVQESTLAAYARQDVPFDRVVSEVNPERSANRMPLTQLLFTVQNAILDRDQWGPLEIEWLEVDTGTSKFDVNITIEQNRDRFTIVAEYSTELFEAATIEQLCRHYLNLLAHFAADPSAKVWRAEMLDSTEKTLLLEHWNATEVPLPEPCTIDGVFAGRVRERPEAVALSFPNGQWSYRELDQRADMLARHLRRLGAGPESKIGVFLERGPEAIRATLAILKVGGCYVPLDPEYPEERLKCLAEGAGLELLVTSRALAARLPSLPAQTVLLEETPETGLPPLDAPRHAGDGAAYIMFTSGSTGSPKGVVVTHQNVVRLVCGQRFMTVGPDDVFLQYAPAAFDASTFEIWASLLNGARLCVMPPGQASLKDLGEAIRRFRVSTLFLTTGLFNLVVDEQVESLRGVRQVLTGGDVASPRHFQRLLEHHPRCRLLNAYGPTENGAFTTVAHITLADLKEGMVPIGRTVCNTRCYVLDRFMQPVPIGVAGELYTGGAGVARGYLNAPELTRRKFMPNPFRPGDRLYRTGDLVRYRPDGNLQFIGRVDNQVKIRGFRIEPGEIEEALRLHPAVRQVLVLAMELRPGEKNLVAYWTPNPGVPLPSQAELRAFLKRYLPEPMLPAVSIQLEQFPLDAHGKIDRRALPAPAAAPDAAAPAAELSPLEEKLLGVWREVFSRPEMTATENFFDLGGHSLLATQVVSRIRQQLNIDLPVRAIFDYSTVAELASFVSSQAERSQARTSPAEIRA